MMSTYVFKLKKGELELELQSDDPHFIEAQMQQWREQLLNPTVASQQGYANTVAGIQAPQRNAQRLYAE